MAKVTIIDGNDEIELSTAPKENIKAFMVKGERGTDGVSPTISTSKTDKITTIEITDKDGTKVASISDGFDPIVNVSKANRVATISITDAEGTETTQIYDGIDLTGGVPTNGVIGWDDDNIFYSCDGTETGTYYLTYNTVSYYFTMPTVAEGDILLFNTTNLELSLDGTIISTSSSGTGTELTFDEYIPNGYEATTELQEKLVSGTNIKTINNTSILGNGNISIGGTSVNDSYSTSTTEPYSCNYVNNLNTYSTTEKIVGKTENGETIYEKTLIYTSALTSGFNAIPHGVVNKGTNIAAWGHINNSPYLLGAFENANAFVNVNYMDATSVGIVVGTQWGNAFQSGCTVTIQYTKTTV